jgi:peptidoglycan-associated lipoprotein
MLRATSEEIEKMACKRTITIVCMLAATAGVGCGKTVLSPNSSRPGASAANAVPAPPPAALAPNASVAPAPRSLSEDELFAEKTLEELNSESPLKTVYFALDHASLDEQARMVLQANAQWLTRWPSTHVFIQGHTDQRGTTEYNLALGDRRAAAAKDYLENLGVSPDRLVLVSNGEETPVCGEQAESCWWQNRRGMFVISAK